MSSEDIWKHWTWRGLLWVHVERLLKFLLQVVHQHRIFWCHFVDFQWTVLNYSDSLCQSMFQESINFDFLHWKCRKRVSQCRLSGVERWTLIQLKIKESHVVDIFMDQQLALEISLGILPVTRSTLLLQEIRIWLSMVVRAHMIPTSDSIDTRHILSDAV